jgi:hypothetical protein
MTSRHTGSWRLLVAALAVSGAAQAATPWVQVEVIAFQYTQTGSETWAGSLDLPDLEHARALDGAVAETGAAEVSAVPLAYRALAPHELKLAGAWKVLGRAGPLRPVLHLGWRQPDTDSRDVRLRPASADGRDRLDAEAGLAPAFDGALRVVPAGEDAWKLSVRCVTRAGDVPVAYSETRRLRLDELHYLDHPLFGVLVQVTAVALPGAPADALDAVAPAGETAVSPGVLPD